MRRAVKVLLLSFVILLGTVAGSADDRCPLVQTDMILVPFVRGGSGCWQILSVYEDCNGNVTYEVNGFFCI